MQRAEFVKAIVDQDLITQHMQKINSNNNNNNINGNKNGNNTTVHNQKQQNSTPQLPSRPRGDEKNQISSSSPPNPSPSLSRSGDRNYIDLVEDEENQNEDSSQQSDNSNQKKDNHQQIFEDLFSINKPLLASKKIFFFFLIFF